MVQNWVESITSWFIYRSLVIRLQATVSSFCGRVHRACHQLFSSFHLCSASGPGTRKDRKLVELNNEREIVWDVIKQSQQCNYLMLWLTFHKNLTSLDCFLNCISQSKHQQMFHLGFRLGDSIEHGKWINAQSPPRLNASTYNKPFEVFQCKGTSNTTDESQSSNGWFATKTFGVWNYLRVGVQETTIY